MKKKNDLTKLSSIRKIKLIKQIHKKFILNKKFSKLKVLTKVERLKFFFFKLKKNCPKLLKGFSLKRLLHKFKKKIKTRKIRKPIKQQYKKNTKFLTKSLKKILINFPNVDVFSNQKKRIIKKIVKMSDISTRTKLRRNLSTRTFFFKIIRKKRRRKLKAFRINKVKPIFTKKSKKEKKFLLRARESLLKTKKYLYRKQFPKIKGKKNKNFNFFYYNNMDRIPFKFHIGRVVITYLLNNTFINIHNSKKMLKVLSAGKIGFKGPKRSTPYSRQVVARKAIKFISKTKLNVLDIFLNSNYNRWYYFLFKEISKPRVRPYVIRYLVISNPRPHGFIRDRKHRRK